MPKEDNGSGGKFITTIIIGGALGSVAAILFGRRKKKTFSEKVHDILDGKKEEKKEGIFSRLFGKGK